MVGSLGYIGLPEGFYKYGNYPPENVLRRQEPTSEGVCVCVFGVSVASSFGCQHRGCCGLAGSWLLP